MQPFFHDGKVVFQQVEQFRGNALPRLQAREDKSRDLDALPIPARAANDDWDVKHGHKSPWSIPPDFAASWLTMASCVLQSREA
jgi:hypothetical protein